MPPSRFIADASLEGIARPLRFLGYDVAPLRGASLEQLLESARREGRIALTHSARHPRRFADVAVLRVRRGASGEAVREIAAAHDPAGSPFSRCGLCNAPLRRRHPFEARGEVPGRVLRVARWIGDCPGCGKWYWDGSHVARIREWLERALGRPIPGAWPGEEPPAGTPGGAPGLSGS